MTWLIYGLISYSEWLVQRRWLKGYKTKWKKREEREEKIFQHVGKTSKPVERVYVWGNATTGALGKSYQPITITCLCNSSGCRMTIFWIQNCDIFLIFAQK